MLPEYLDVRPVKAPIIVIFLFVASIVHTVLYFLLVVTEQDTLLYICTYVGQFITIEPVLLIELLGVKDIL